MNLMSIVTVVSLIIGISNGIGMILMYLWYAKGIRGAIMESTILFEVSIIIMRIMLSIAEQFELPGITRRSGHIREITSRIRA